MQLECCKWNGEKPNTIWREMVSVRNFSQDLEHITAPKLLSSEYDKSRNDLLLSYGCVSLLVLLDLNAAFWPQYCLKIMLALAWFKSYNQITDKNESQVQYVSTTRLSTRTDDFVGWYSALYFLEVRQNLPILQMTA